MNYDEKISGARIRTHDLWIRKRVCYPLHHSASQTGNTETLCVTSESDDTMTMSRVLCSMCGATETNCVRLNESKISINFMRLVSDSLLMCMLKSPVMIKLLGVLEMIENRSGRLKIQQSVLMNWVADRYSKPRDCQMVI